MKISFLLMILLAPALCYSLEDPELTKTEKIFLDKQPKKFVRTKEMLTLLLTNKKKKTYKDNLDENNGAYSKTVVNDYNSKNDVAVLQQIYYEGGQFLVVSLKDGSEIKVPTKPLWSPDQNNFISVNDDESDYTENRIIIGTCKAKKCTQAFAENNHAADAKWVNDKTVEFEKREFNPATGTSKNSMFTCKIEKKVTCVSKK